METRPREATDLVAVDQDEATREANKRLVRRYVEEVLNQGNLALLDDLVADDHVEHGPLGNQCGLESIRLDVLGCRAAFPDLRFEIVDLVAEADRVARRFVATCTHLGPFLGVAPTGRRVTVAGLAINRIAADKLAETWLDLDLYGLLRQLGALSDELHR